MREKSNQTGQYVIAYRKEETRSKIILQSKTCKNNISRNQEYWIPLPITLILGTRVHFGHMWLIKLPMSCMKSTQG
jgi:hypothetical protein